MIVLLAGAPGVGKSTVAARLACRGDLQCEIVSFGALLYDQVRARTPDVSYAEFRRLAAELVQRADMEAADDQLSLLASATKSDSWLVVDSHAVASEKWGLHSNPDPPEKLHRYGYDLIVLLDLPASKLFDRVIKNGSEGRKTRSKREARLLAQAQMMVATYYAGTLGCPLWIVDAAWPVEDVVDNVAQILRAYNAG